jgi:hypothetical protein
MMRPLIRNVVASIRASASARWIAVRQLRSETRALLSERRACRQHARRAVGRPPARGRKDGDTWLEVEVLRIIARHPEGIRALDIGNELGVDWRHVPAVTSRLIERAVIEQVEHDFYPVAKAS